jgi:hypothetical protein
MTLMVYVYETEYLCANEDIMRVKYLSNKVYAYSERFEEWAYCQVIS